MTSTTTTSETYVGGRSAFALEDRGLVVVRLKSGWHMQAKLTDAGVAEARRHARCTTHVGRFRCAPAAG